MAGIGLCETIITTLLTGFLIGTDFWIIVREAAEHITAIDAVLEKTEEEQGGQKGEA